MSELMAWIGQFENSKPLALVLFFAAFCGVLIYAFGGSRERAQRLESYKNIPLQDDDEIPRRGEQQKKGGYEDE